MSSFWRLLMASRINPSLLINSVYIRSAPLSLHTARKGGSLTSSIGASNKGKSGNSIWSIFTILRYGSTKQITNLQPYFAKHAAKVYYQLPFTVCDIDRFA